jgi:hypothetical protein
VIELLGFAKAPDGNVAWPPASSGAVPSVVVPFLNVTEPVGVPPLLVTVAVNVTGDPYGAGLAEDVSAVVVAA